MIRICELLHPVDSAWCNPVFTLIRRPFLMHCADFNASQTAWLQSGRVTWACNQPAQNKLHWNFSTHHSSLQVWGIELTTTLITMNKRSVMTQSRSTH